MDAGKSHLHSIVDLDGATILDIQHGVISTLNPMGAQIWLALKRGDSLEDIVSEIGRLTGAEMSTVDRDVRAFVESLTRSHLLPNT